MSDGTAVRRRSTGLRLLSEAATVDVKSETEAPAAPARLAPALTRHPCYAPAAQGLHGRMHLPVSPTCNILCRFCVRRFASMEERPGVARGLLDPAAAADAVARALRLCPQLSVVGVAGPGEPLATPHALEALELVHERHPDLIGCLSTNGLELASNVDRIVRAGVQSVTVTVNALAPSLLSRLCNGVLDRGRYVRGLKGAELLIDAQMAGVQTAARSGLTVKVNSVLVPGVNEHHIRDIARAAARLGASLMNVIPLIPQAELASVPAPDCALVDRVRREVERFLPAFRHCRRCRADACGIPGGIDHGTELYGHDSPASGGETFAHG